MSLPGKLSIGILEEDNPLRSYFRYKPLLVDDNGKYIPYEDHAHYPDEGCIRIVPDKNESYHFKVRMRQIGLFSVVDLRAHPGESDKIRPNKNYRPESEEINASIIYSDVVRAPAAGTLWEILPAADADRPIPQPHTENVLLRDGDGLSPQLYLWEAIPDSDGMGRLCPAEALCPLDGAQVFELPGFRDETVAFAIRPASTVERVSDMPDKPHKESAAKEAREKEAPEAPKPEAEAPKPEPQPEPPAEPAAREADDAPEKPWIHRDESMLPPPIDRRLNRSEQLMAAQAGLNPRRGRSLQELIDEKWQRSRLNQLGQPVQPIATGAPVQNPVDAAVKAVGSAWEDPQLQAPLLDALREIEGFYHSVDAQREFACRSEIEERLNSLEARRLELMDELDQLKAGGEGIRQKLKQEILRDEAGALADAHRKTEAAREEQARCEQQAADARVAAQDAQGLLDALAGDELEQKIREVALTRRVMERLELLQGDAGATAAPVTAERVDLAQLIDRACARFEAEGWKLSRFEAANLCACLAIGPVVMLSGAPGSGKTAAARLLADALGLTAAGRTVLCPPGIGTIPGRGLRTDARMAALRRHEAAPAVIILDDANLICAPDPLRGLAQTAHAEWRVIATLQDVHSGHPLSAGTLDKGFLIRLSAPAGLPWRPAGRHAVEAFPPASVSAALESIPDIDLPTAMVERMEALCRDAEACGAAVSRRALGDAWRYCAAMRACLGDEADPNQLLDLAIAQRVLPALLAAAPEKALSRLCALVRDLPACRALLEQPAPITVL